MPVIVLYTKRNKILSKKIFMRRIEKTKLPKWIVSKLPYKGEDEVISSILVPFVLFSFMGIGLAWHELYNPEWLFIEVLITTVLVGAVLASAWWVLAQVDLLIRCRRELMLCYKLTKNSEEKEKIKKKLEKNFYVFVK